MQPTTQLYRNSVAFFLVFSALVVWGFWDSYFSDPSQLSGLALHLHGFAMSAWCVMLITQAYLIRAGRRSLHRAIGRVSYVLAPMNVILPIIVVRQRLPLYPTDFLEGRLTPSGQSFLTGTFVIAATFALLYGLAIVYRRSPAIHGRYMLSTVFPVLPAATDRILRAYFPGVVGTLPEVAGIPYAQSVAYGISLVALIALSIWDWRSDRRLMVFPIVLAIVVSHQVLAVTAHKVPLWGALGAWFMGN